ncbi:ABC transporter permease [Gordonia sp. HY442]|uniref:ABC transporter permease n=1 Tax=Gordonia zhenghanii TaxID=2911516 RepID=UPI001F29D16F|nr:FtsX-like permease family protein [Gordonia zhenghanii]MCF8606411.1 ABC transporter permease [Gordonia zhenghanii]
MYIGWREIRDAKGRFALISGVIALLSLMVVMLSALTAGLDAESTSAVRALPGDTVITQSAAGGEASSLTDSRVDDAAISQVRADDPQATVLGVANTRITADGRAAAVAAFGFSDTDEVTVDSETAEALGVSAGSDVVVGTERVRVDAVGDTDKYAHTPVVRMPYSMWVTATGRDAASAVLTSDSTAPSGTAATSHSDAVSLVPGYKSEHSSLLLIQGLLLAISAIVVCGFFAVWTGQRVRSLAVVRAMGAGRNYLMRDGLGQAAVVLFAGLIAGGAVGAIGAWIASGTVPIAFEAGSMIALLAGMAVLGLAGAAIALRPLVKVDPLTALNR